MSTARISFGTLLPNNRVLIAGGIGPGTYPSSILATAELYDPATGTFSATGTMATARLGPATLLPDGRVLIAGGEGISGPLATAELYDPATGTFSLTGSMAMSRGYSTATLLNDGRVLVAGGQDASGTWLASAELYSPKTGAFTPTGSMTVLGPHTATLLSDGRVLMTGGCSPKGCGSNVLASAELYDPSTGTFGPTASMTTARSGAGATRLADGRVLIAGGCAAWICTTSEQLLSAELYDPETGTFSPTGSMTVVGPHTVALLSDGRVLALGGYNGIADLYDPNTGAFARTSSMTTARTSPSATLLSDGRVLVAGGYDASEKVLASAEIYQP